MQSPKINTLIKNLQILCLQFNSENLAKKRAMNVQRKMKRAMKTNAKSLESFEANANLESALAKQEIILAATEMSSRISFLAQFPQT